MDRRPDVDRRPGAGAAPGLEIIIARLMTVGTYVAIGFVLLGVAGMLLTAVDPLDHGTPPAFDLGRIPGDLLALRPEGFLWAGLVVVMGIPIGRVIVAGVGFLRVGERRLAAISLAVLLVVLAAILAAQGLEG